MSAEPLPHHLETTAIRAGRSANGASLSTPLWASSVWASPTLEHARKAAVGGEDHNRSAIDALRLRGQDVVNVGVRSDRRHSAGDGA